MAFSKFPALAFCALTLLFLVSLWPVPCGAQRCNTFLTFNGSTVNFTKCTALPAQGSLLAWTFNEDNSTLSVAFEGIAPSASGWVGWGVNPTTPSQMAGSSVLIAFQAAENGSNVLPYKLTSEVKLLQMPLNCTPIDLIINTMAVEIEGASMRLFAILQLEPNQTVLNHVWNRGSTVRNFQPRQHELLGENLRGAQTIDMYTAQSVGGIAGLPHQSLKGAHGIINTLSWGILLPLGAIVARYLRQVPALDNIWFYVHVPCQLLGYLLGTMGWAIGMRLLALSSAVRVTHRNIGIALFAMATIQVCAFLYHPKKDSKYRRALDNPAHRVGRLLTVGPIVHARLVFGPPSTNASRPGMVSKNSGPFSILPASHASNQKKIQKPA
ncbi:hypothetical protein GOP47_0013849 [Adiantum capillus-veneris]|uniref:Cytochrome b561 and DOMON domain-containing protein n=1 Tax=Adiantum capillus-veneris TaxID=13818 RepID=A0A9D4UQJ3_ADICA|nr:hypothetical protein GOP47_0013849 [Adiantum capillus-veneris]